MMKEKLFFIGLLLCLFGTQINAQCAGCSDNGQITEPSEDNFTAQSADAYFWEICSGNATINGNIKSQSVSVTCNEGPSTIKVTRFVDGECVESCKTICPEDPPECECPSFIPESCMVITTEGCSTAFFTIKSSCLPDPDCIEEITWQIGLGTYFDEFTDNNTSISWDIPSGDWPNHYLVGKAFIKLTSGEVCEYGNRILIDCPKGGGHGGGENRLLGPDTENSPAVYPNPALRGGVISLSAKIMEALESVDLLNAKGAVISTLKANDLTIPSNIEAGVYFLNIHTANGTSTHKVIIQ